MNETQEFGACTSIVTEMRFIGMNADQSRELEEPIVAAACRHYFLEPAAVHVLGHRTLSIHDNDAHAPGLHRRLHANHTHAVVDLVLRERAEMANDTADRASLPMDSWIVEALREEFVENGAEELGVDVAALEIVLAEIGRQVDIQRYYLCGPYFVKRSLQMRAEERRANEMNESLRRNFKTEVTLYQCNKCITIMI